jgi:putative N-acetylmannosamine-6-phosphate epimerase
VIGPSQRPQPGNTQHSQQTDVHYPGGIRTYNPNKQVAADLRITTRCHWDPPILTFMKRDYLNLLVYICVSFVDIVTELGSETEILCFTGTEYVEQQWYS